MRLASWIVALLAYIGPSVWAHFALNSAYPSGAEHHVHACGLPAMGIYTIASIAYALLSLVAGFLAWRAFRVLPLPRSRVRGLEVGVLVVPGLGAVAFLAYAVILLSQ